MKNCVVLWHSFLGRAFLKASFWGNIWCFAAFLAQEVKICWIPIHKMAFKLLKELLIKTPVFKHNNVEGPMIVLLDASSLKLSAVLLQKAHLLHMLPKHWQLPRKNHVQREKEMLATRFKYTKSHPYIFERNSDCRNKPQTTVIFRKPLYTQYTGIMYCLVMLEEYHQEWSIKQRGKHYCCSLQAI